PDHAALAVHRADAVAVAVECNPEVELFAGDERFQGCEVLLDRRVGVMVVKPAVDLAEDDVMLSGQALHEHVEDRPRGAVSGVPADPVRVAGEAFEQAVYMGFADIALFHAAAAFVPMAGRGALADLLDLRAED